MRAAAPAGALLAFRLGEWIEFFQEDADTAGPVVGAEVIDRPQGIRIAGVKHTEAGEAFGKLLAAGEVVALVDGTPRQVVRVLTPRLSVAA